MEVLKVLAGFMQPDTPSHSQALDCCERLFLYSMLAAPIRAAKDADAGRKQAGFNDVHHALALIGQVFTRIDLDRPAARGPMGRCYANSLDMTWHDPARYVYVEGVVARVPWVLHGFVYDLKQKAVIDPTWKPEPGDTYIGLPYDFTALYARSRDGDPPFPVLNTPEFLNGDQSVTAMLHHEFLEGFAEERERREKRFTEQFIEQEPLAALFGGGVFG